MQPWYKQASTSAWTFHWSTQLPFFAVVALVVVIAIVLLVTKMRTPAAPAPAPVPKPAPKPAPAPVPKPAPKPSAAPKQAPVPKPAPKPAPAPAPTVAPTTLPAAAAPAAATGKQTLWDCQRDSKSQGPVKITWGYRTEDATWACNEWRAGCEKKCTAVAATQGPNQEYWSCVDSSGKTLDPIKLWWGYKPTDAAWACNEWMPACGKKCTAVPLTN